MEKKIQPIDEHEIPTNEEYRELAADIFTPTPPRKVTRAKEKLEPVMYEKPVPQQPNIIINWFSENTLAKVGGLLIFLAIIAFLSVIYTQI